MNPPKHLSREAKSIWRKVLEGYELEDWHCRVLQSALEAWDRMQQARETLVLLLRDAGQLDLDARRQAERVDAFLDRG